jgi:dCMP deaminase
MANWNKRFMDLARHIAEWSKDTNTKVGAVIVDDENTILSVGYNGFPRGADDGIKERYERPKKYIYTEHSERNAIFNAVRSGVPLKNSKIYVTMAPCHECARAIINSGIKTVVSYEPDYSHERWGESFIASVQMFKECGVNFLIFSDEHDEFYKNIDCFLNLEWDYKNVDETMFSLQRDWNQTLITRINQAAANIFQRTLTMGANKIRVGSEIFSIIEDLEYFNKKEMILSGRYKVIIDNNIPKDEIIVYYDASNGLYVPTEEDLERGIKKRENKDRYASIKVLNYEFPCNDIT